MGREDHQSIRLKCYFSNIQLAYSYIQMVYKQLEIINKQLRIVREYEFENY